jgi:pimeloyl-ACP methyl ester carboxylesterase
MAPVHGQVVWEEGAVEVDGGQLFYRVGGIGPPLLMLHGMTGVAQEWDLYTDRLAEHYTLVVPDLLGHGRSRNYTGVFELPHVTRTVLQLTESLGIERFAAIGYSIGGVTLLHMARAAPERMAGMVIVAGGHRVSADRREEIRNSPPFEDLPSAARDWFLQYHPGGEVQTRELLAHRRALSDNYIDLSETELGEIEVPALLVWGEDDAAFPMPIPFELQQALPRADLWLIDGQGHSLLWPDWGGSEMVVSQLPATVVAFLDRVGF